MFRFTTFLRDLATIRTALILSAIFFAAGIAAGWGTTGPIQEILVKEIQTLGQAAEQMRNSDQPELNFFIFIFLNNAIKSLIVMFAGIVLGIIPFVFLAINGMVIGFLLHMISDNGGNLSEIIFKGLLPHGIIEIPVLLIASAYGMVLGALVIKSIVPGADRGDPIKQKWKVTWRKTGTASLWIVILLFLAAIIESTITLWLMS
ncbi:stage II sporulation protein M [Paenibacillus lemnae]|uniref:Stage II sporulation protein M n=1 Tax=Paenibacillus lemnae TaxID=1330551 RepID=A0A848MDG8_PAELE|nr:stage II sporulation protein M [Paenibacillus lemnae]NMO97474.1 stage II sporulation protein M [Paenibacillus lemnae]